jgi:surface antigen
MLTVEGRGAGGTLSLARAVHVLQYAGATPRPAASSLSSAARLWWASSSASILAGFHTGASTGECTAYVAARRPDIIKRVDMSAYSRYLLAGRGGLNVNWDAMNWPQNARRVGMTVGKRPRPGAAIVFQAGAYGATSLGHIAYVNTVGRDGSFTITEMHAPVLGRVTSRHFDARTARAMGSNPGIAFIYR